MSLAAALLGWALAAGLALGLLRLARRLEMVGSAAHELRGAAGSLELLASGLRREPRGAGRAAALQPALDRMRGALADLDRARGLAGPGTRTETVSLDPLLRGIAAGWGPAPGFAGRRMRLTWDGRPARVRADRRRLAQVFSNLVANAVEHGSGEVELHGRRERDRVVVEVRDGGPARAPAAAAARARDRGRGLAIAGRAAEEVGGRLRLESGPRGTVAAIELPAAADREGP